MSSANPVVATYTVVLTVPGVPDSAIRSLNRGWGFTDGHVNDMAPDGTLQGRPGSGDPKLLEAHQKARRSSSVTVRVSLHRNGQRTYELE